MQHTQVDENNSFIVRKIQSIYVQTFNNNHRHSGGNGGVVGA